MSRLPIPRCPIWRSPWLLGAVAALYPLLPGHPAAWSTGLPLSVEWLGVFVAIIASFAALARGWQSEAHLASSASAGRWPFRRLLAAAQTERLWGLLTLGVTLLCLAKLAAWSVSPTPGLVARYYSFDNDRPVDQPERSTDFLWLPDATRIDRRLGLSGEGFPLYFFNNNQRWNHYKPSETPHDQLPFVATWDGYLVVPHAGSYRFWLSSEGPAQLSIAGRPLLRTTSDGARAEDRAQVELPAGLVPLHIAYERIEGQGRRLRVEWDGGGTRATLGAPDLLAFAPSPLSQALATPAARLGQLSDGLYLLALLAALALLLLGHLRATLAGTGGRGGARTALLLLERPLLALLVLLFLGHALALAAGIQGQMVFLQAGDDPLTRETQAREIGINGPLMTFGEPLGKGKPYYSQILYPYLLALGHRLAGEPLAGVYVLQVTLVGVLVALTYLLGKRLFGAPAAAIAAALFGVLAWQEYVPVAQTLFAEVLYGPMMALALLALLLALRWPSWWRLALASLLLTAAVLIRFTGMAFVPIAAALVWWELRAQGWPRGRALGGVAALLSVLGLGLALVLARNLVVASTPTFIPTSLGNNLVKLHRPPGTVDLRATRSPVYEALHLDMPIRQVIEFARQDFPGYVRSLVPQALYAAGYTGLVEPDQPYHPGFLGGMLLYLLALGTARARARPALLLHGFVLSHWALMALFFASQYRYRLILPMYPFVYVSAGYTLWWLVCLLGSCPGGRIPLLGQRAIASEPSATGKGDTGPLGEGSEYGARAGS